VNFFLVEILALIMRKLLDLLEMLGLALTILILVISRLEIILVIFIDSNVAFGHFGDFIDSNFAFGLFGVFY
jgi:hypothetical protein